MPVEYAIPSRVAASHQAFVKFFGEASNRIDRESRIFDEVSRAGCHWACTYPRGKRPRAVRDGAVMFMGRLVNEPNDTIIFGRAIGLRHEPGRDDATAADIKKRWWKDRWPHYVRVHDAEFVDGPLANGISLAELMEKWGPNSFFSTKMNLNVGAGNTDPRRAFMQQAAVQFTAESATWLNERLELAFEENGRITPAALEQLDWPETLARSAGAK
jgi:hypothetical protein